MAETKLVSVPEGFLHSLRSLKVLILAGNQLKAVPQELQRAVNLKYLNLNNNPIRTMNSESFLGLKSLKQLNISSMAELENITANTFGPLVSLHSLWCSFNSKLRKIDPKAFSTIESKEIKTLSEVKYFTKLIRETINRKVILFAVSFPGKRHIADITISVTMG